MTSTARTRLRARTGLLLSIALIALGATLFADVFVAAGGQSSRTVSGDDQFFSDRFVNVVEVEAPPGSIVRVYPGAAAQGPFDRIEFYIVEHGQGQAYTEGGAAQDVYAQHTQTADALCCTAVEVKRPAPPAGVDGQWLDLVWVLHFEEGTSPPASGEAREYFERWIDAQGVGSTPQVTSPAAAAFHRWVAVPLLAVLSAAAVVLAFLWVRDVLAPRRDVAADEEAASGVALVDLGGQSLAFLRGLLLGVAVPLVYVIWVSGYFFLNEIDATPGFGGVGGSVMEGALYVAFAVLAVAWAAATLRIMRSHRRWRALMDAPPLPL
jgi:hypothetical protein